MSIWACNFTSRSVITVELSRPAYTEEGRPLKLSWRARRQRRAGRRPGAVPLVLCFTPQASRSVAALVQVFFEVAPGLVKFVEVEAPVLLVNIDAVTRRDARGHERTPHHVVLGARLQVDAVGTSTFDRTELIDNPSPVGIAPFVCRDDKFS
jgi:hypothetical protein